MESKSLITIRNNEYLAQFTGSYVYMIRDKRTQRIVYIGETNNFVRRHWAHFGKPSDRSAFNRWCIKENEDKSDYEMVVLELTHYDTIDFDDRVILEKAMIMCHKDSVVNKYIPQSLSAYEMERYEYIMGVIEPNFKVYTQIKVEKMAKKIA